MLKYILKRMFLAIITIIIALTITFFILKMINNIPTAIEDEISNKILAGDKRPEIEIREEIYNKYSYHPEFNSFKAFGIYISNLFKGDFGFYYSKSDATIPEQFSQPLKYTFLVSGTGFALGTILGVSFGIIAGYKRGRWPDIALNLFSIIFVAVPSFVLAAILVITASRTGWPTEFLSPSFAGGIWPMMKTLILPISVIMVTSFATITYYVRNEVVEVLKSDYVATARSKGLSEVSIFSRHVMRNISIPSVSIILPRFVFIILGSLIIELFFGVPGTAKIFSTAVTSYEYNVIMFSIIFFSSLSLFLNIFIDVLYTILDPRIKLADKSNFSIWTRFKKIASRAQSAKTVNSKVKSLEDANE